MPSGVQNKLEYRISNPYNGQHNTQGLGAYMRIFTSNGIAVALCLIILMSIITACGNGNGGSADNNLPAYKDLNSIKAENQNYLLYESNGAILARNYKAPFTPITLEPDNGTVGASVANAVIPFGESSPGKPANTFSTNSAVTYAKNGQIWTIDNINKGNTIARRVSNEDSADTLCQAASGKVSDSRSDSYNYSYTLPGSDTTCYSKTWSQHPDLNDAWIPVFSDNIRKIVKGNDTADTPPRVLSSTINSSRADAIVFVENGLAIGATTTLGLLTLDNLGNLLWLDGANVETPATTVATGITDFDSLYHYGNNISYLSINGELRSYTAGDTELGEKLTELVDPNFSRVGRLAPNTQLLRDGTRLLSINRQVIEAPTILADDPLVATTTGLLGTSANTLFFYAIIPERIQAYSVDQATGEVTALFSVTKNPRNNIPPLNARLVNERLYYSDDITLTTNIITTNNVQLASFPNTTIVGAVTEPTQRYATSSITHLLLNEKINESQGTIKSLNVATNKIEATLGNVDLDAKIFINTPQYDGRFFFTLVSGLAVEQTIYYADLNEQNSLRQITDATTVDRILGTMPRVPVPPAPQPPAPPPPMVPPPPPPPPPIRVSPPLPAS